MARGSWKVKYVFAGGLIVTCVLLRIYTLPSRSRNDVNVYKTFSFIQPVGTDFCPDLFVNQNKDLPKPVEYSDVFDTFYRKFEGLNPPQSFMFLYPEQANIIHKLAQQPVVKQICQLGFHAGYETLLMLTAKSTNKVVVFDSGMNEYSKEMADHLEKQFSSRLDVIFGDPESHIPVWSLGGDTECDMVVIRGSHSRRTLVREIRAIERACALEALVVMDNYPPGETLNGGREAYIDGAWQAWEALVGNAEYRARLTCSYQRQQLGPAFTVGILTPDKT